MDPTKIPPSFLTFIADETVFLVCFFPFVTIPSDFATNLWGDKVPYGKTVQIRDGNSLRSVRIRKRNGEPIFPDGWIMLVRDKDGVWITAATGPYTFNVSCFKEFVCQNSYFTAQINDVPYMNLMPDKFWNNFYGKKYKGEMARVYVGQRFWDVKLEASSECCCFKDGWLKLVEEVPLKNEPYLVFTMIDLKTFELSVFDHERGTEMVFKKDDVDKGKCKIDTEKVLVKGKSKVDDAQKRRKTVQKVNPQSPVLNFTRFAEHRIRLPAKVSSVLDLSPDNLKEVRVQNLTGEVKNIMTTSKKHRKGFRYGFVGWSSYLKAWKIKIGSELFFEFYKSTKLLRLSKVVEKGCVKKKNLRA
ncbi:putative transcription factor B3-Domain family [Helianthus annuus]|nr:putative transcription factor B3-Domain family [Helianthus annuus]KAJ0772624.1 putative transcription factor B3-Domain family [Helianthus annuus]